MTDAEAVTRFEAFVHNQQSAPAWTPVTPYDFESRRIAEGKHPDVIVDTFGAGPYLDYGCGPDAILVRLLRERGVFAYGIDPLMRETWQCFQPKFDNGPEEFVGHFPVVICREVFEHCQVLRIPELIRRFKLFAPKYIYVTTRFAKQPDHLLSVETEFDADPTHITCLTKPFLRTLFILEGCKSRPDLEAKMDWQKKGRCLVFEVS
jgi:hypothetical protein